MVSFRTGATPKSFPTAALLLNLSKRVIHFGRPKPSSDERVSLFLDTIEWCIGVAHAARVWSARGALKLLGLIAFGGLDRRHRIALATDDVTAV